MDILEGIGEAVIEGAADKVSGRITNLSGKVLITFFRSLGAGVIFVLSRGKNGYAVAYRYHNSTYYGIAIMFVILITGLAYWCFA